MRTHHWKWLQGATLALTVWPSNALAQGEEVDGSQMIAEAKAVRAFVPKDQFDSPPAGPKWLGRKFAYTVKPQAWPAGSYHCTGMPTWDYREGQLTVSARSDFINPFSFSGSFNSPGRQKSGLMGDLNFNSITCAQSLLVDQEAVTAFNAKFTVKTWTDTAVGVFDTSADEFKGKVYWKANLNGATARTLSENLVVRVSGTLRAWPNGRMIVCGLERGQPTLTNRTDRTRDVCGYFGRIDRIEIIDSSSGKGLYTVTRQTLD